MFRNEIGNEKKRTLSPRTKRKKDKMKVGSYAVIATNLSPSDAFTKAREPQRLESVADEIEDNEEDQPSTSTHRDSEWDMVKI